MGITLKTKLFLVTYVLLKNKNKKRRRYWIHPYLKNRPTMGLFHKIIKELEKYPPLYFKYFRMSQRNFNKLFNILRSTLEPKPSSFRDCVSAKEKLVITIRFLATGCSFRDLSFHFCWGYSTIGKIVRETLEAIHKIIMPIVMPSTLQENDWLEISNDFLKYWNFPNCLGAVDGKHVQIVSFGNSGSINFNYKKHFSIILLALVDAKYKFIYVDVGAHGSMADSTVFTNSQFGQKWLQNKLNVPSPQPLPGTKFEKIPFVIVGDEAFALKPTIPRPYPGKKLNRKKLIFNYRLSRARRIVENTFGICAQIWRILLKRIQCNEKLTKLIVTCCCVLHNFLRIAKSNQSAPVDDIPNSQNADAHDISNLRAFDIRESFANWFIAEGDVPWQHKHINPN